MDNIDIFEILGHIWRKKLFVIRCMIIFFVIGILMAVFTPNQYVSNTVILPQISGSPGLGKKLGGFARLVGLNLDDNGKNEIFPTLYPVIATSIPFQKGLLYSEVKTGDSGNKINLNDYLESINLNSPSDYVYKYTVGLPGRIVRMFRSKEEKTYKNVDTTIIQLSKAEKSKIAYLEKHMDVSFNELEGFVEISVSIPDAEVSANLAKNVQILLQDKIIDFNISKAREELKYLNKRYNEAEQVYEEKRQKLGQFRDRNKNYISSVSENRYEQLKTENDLAFNVYSQLASQVESAKLQVKRDTPVFTVLKPVSVPLEPAGPSKLILIIAYIIVGAVLGAGIIVFRKLFPEIKAKLNQKPIE
ncbi:Wzz/FepE/Etk N-terminal domain-containing protein [Gilvibacter sp.]|uniref:Wzz/FepE/Etk N-terminal domain-containing protein n=1 Tax=Gilvibacter sp. TaxID=2729997 RepID=UPI0025BE3617|nr:Wzz/FepE/Etk N-terminal domain-containing protein [Gilvibacter sp.]NQX76894.1 hypothetical protein [Gilvibacter sp.]